MIGRDYVVEKLDVGGRTFSYRQPEGAFMARQRVEQKMLNWAYEALGDRSDDLLELYCDSGNCLPGHSACAKCWPPRSASFSERGAEQPR